MYTLKYSKQANKIKAKMPKGIAAHLETELETIAINPQVYQGDWKPLYGTPFYRLRVGSWRVICQIINNELIIYILKIGSRGDIYK